MIECKKYYRGSAAPVTCLIFILVCFSSCQQYQKNSTHQQVSDESITIGKQLAITYCQSCHLLPDPSQLDAKSWEKGVLPSMGPRLGIFNYGLATYPSYRFDRGLGENFYPSKPMLQQEQWQSIIDYYTSLAPDSLVTDKNDIPIESGLDLFKPAMPSYNYDDSAKTCFVGIDTAMVPGTLAICDAVNKSILRLNNHLEIIDSVHAKWPVTDLDLQKNNGIACNIGIMVPNNGCYGTANYLRLGADGKMKYNNDPTFDSLRRPVQVTSCDLNKDNKEDYLVCEYGNLKGALSWMEHLDSNKFVRHVIKEGPGAIKAHLADYNKDGLTDFYVLFAQGDERLILFINKGSGMFEEKRLLRFPAIYGSTYFELADFNKDGAVDIVYTCGDNADFSPVLKPYHGIYIFINDGQNNFQQKYFFHINGCFKAMARDFDNDGDLDIAAISFFADYKKRPEEGFVYLKNDGKMNFKAFALPETNKGRWLTMDAKDLDGDGKTDIVLGNFSAPAMIKSSVDFEKGPPFLLLKNVGK